MKELLHPSLVSRLSWLLVWKNKSNNRRNEAVRHYGAHNHRLETEPTHEEAMTDMLEVGTRESRARWAAAQTG